MDLNTLTAISPIDGRYRAQLENLAPYFSEFGLIQYRLRIEVEYFIALSQKKIFTLSTSNANKLRTEYQHFTPETALKIKEIEKTTNHDVKALEYYLKEQLDILNLESLKEYIHFGLTSQDVNNTAGPLLWKEALEQEYYPAISNLVIELRKLATAWKNIPLLARTHPLHQR